MQKNSKICIAGHCGLVGSARVRRLQTNGYHNIGGWTHAQLDLRQQAEVQAYFAEEKPEIVLPIQNNVIHNAWKNNVQRLLFLGSSGIYPKACPQPIKAEYLLTGPLEPTNRPYALAKIARVEMCWSYSYNRQYGTKYIAAMPTNLYGANDNYDLNNSHVMSAMIRKMHEAKQSKVMQMK